MTIVQRTSIIEPIR